MSIKSLLFKRRQEIYSKKKAKKIIEKYHGWIGQGVDVETGNLGLGEIHKGFIHTLKPDRVLCVGSYRGFIPVICALACQKNEKGRVDFVDAGKDFGKDNLLGDGFWNRVETEQYFGEVVDAKYIKTYLMTSEEYVKRFSKRKFQYVYIDGDHTYKGIQKDFKLLWPRLARGGMMTFHDVLGKGYRGVKFGVNRFWKELSYDNKILIREPRETGLGILQKP